MPSIHSDPYATPDLESGQSTTETGIATPTHTTFSVCQIEHSCSCSAKSPQTKDTPPYPNQMFAIRERTTGRYITLIEGQLRVLENVGDQGGWLWMCVEKQGWLGFRNPVSSTYMGHDRGGNYWAEYKHHLWQESFCVRRHPLGRYIMLSRKGDELRKVAIGADYKLIEAKKEDTLWDFIKASP
ncbi:hypothetical protein F5Y11DRAFT_21586 [Daldinia sp. FL1419]|nr:hypothetical protein F5Y11DRAFT_21586 [Daldinia sp. FL1419]